MSMACPACAALPEPQEAPAPARGITLSVPDLRCAACIRAVEGTLTALPGVRSARVNLTLKRVSVEGNAAPEALVEALSAAGYSAYPFDPEARKGADNAKARDLMLRLGVAGFAMMNVMLLSVAVWSGASDATRDLFHLISACIALPATLFSAQPFFAHAAAALSAHRLNMDVPISLAIILAMLVSLYEALHGGQHAYFDAALSLTFFLLIGRVLEHHTRAAARSAAEDLAALEVKTALRITASGAVSVPVNELETGDILLVANGMSVPADGIALSSDILTDRSFLTGESDPVLSQKGEMLRAGEINLGAPFELRATRVGEETSLRQIARLVETAETARNSYTTLADRAARIYAPAVHLLALGAFIGWLTATGDPRLALNIAIAVLIITCPCALGLAVPAVAMAAIGRLFSMGFLVKSGTALERLAETDLLLLDKTGTLTEPGSHLDISGLSTTERGIARALAEASHHPVSRALSLRLAAEAPAALTEIREHPGKGLTALAGGAAVALGRGDWLGLPTPGLALRIGAYARPIPMSESLRPGAKSLAPALLAIGLEPRIVSGDTDAKTEQLADTLGIDIWEGGATPEGKHALVDALEASGHRVAMIGDGINDTAALARAHASVAPGSALDAARNAADVILLRPSLEDLPMLMRIARLSTRLARQNFAIAALYNAIAIPIALAGLATPMLAALAMSASSLTVLLNALRIRIAR